MTAVEKMGEAIRFYLRCEGTDIESIIKLEKALEDYESEKDKYTTVLKKDIETVINNIMDTDGDFAGAISMLCRMVGLAYPAGDLKDEDVVLVSISELAVESEFKAPGFTREEDDEN